MDLKLSDHDHEDWDLWTADPETRWVFNKLEVANRCGHLAAPMPCAVPVTGKYCVRPIYNLTGMGLHASIQTLTAGKLQQNQHPGMFWCEYFEGPHYSIDYVWHSDTMVGGWWEPVFATKGYNTDENLIQFTHWNRIEIPDIELPDFLKTLYKNKVLNIEFKGSKIIEVHLRLGNLAGDWLDLDDATTIVPVWESTTQQECRELEQQGYKYIHRDSDTRGMLEDNRKGFYYK